MEVIVLKEFTDWIYKLKDSLETEFNVEIIQHENYFTKINLDSGEYISQIIFWDNHNLYEAEVLSIVSGETLFIKSGEALASDKFSELFRDFFLVIHLKKINLLTQIT